MLNGLNPLLIFQFKIKQSSPTTPGAKIPVKAEPKTFIDLPPIPFYFESNLTGIQVENQDKNIDIQTDTETVSEPPTDFEPTATVEPEISQKGIQSNVTINLTANKNSILISSLSAVMDLIFTKVSSDQYSISYFNGSTSIFRARLQSYQVSENADNSLSSISIILTRGPVDAKKPVLIREVPATIGASPLGAA